MYHYDARTALDELAEEATLPNPVHLRDMILRAQLTPEQALEMNRQLHSYMEHFGDVTRTGRSILEILATAPKRQ
ncbi:MAG: hypothetical protein KIT09_35785 [Bryobacteraceae bacterium]|nr:hypothetical protein [Bryobacteraceae bacterium]